MFGYNPRDYSLKVELAQCCNNLGAVYLAQYTPSEQYVAVKRYRLDRANKEECAMIHDELLVMRQFNHPHLHTFYTAFISGSELQLVAPLRCFGSCKDTINKCFSTGFPEILVALVMRDVLSGLEYMHRRGYIHRAIRASHILLSQTKAVLAGFRESTSFMMHGKRLPALHQLAPFSQRSLNWLAPEVLEQNLIGYTEKSDIYSIGITCCEMANGVEPFSESQPTFMFTEKIRGNVPTLLDSSTCPASEEIIEITAHNADNTEAAIAIQAQQIFSQRSFSDDFHQFTEICMQKQPANRWSVLKLLSHAFFKQCRHTGIVDQLQLYGMQVCDYSQLKDDTLDVTNELNDLSLRDGDWSWDF